MALRASSVMRVLGALRGEWNVADGAGTCVKNTEACHEPVIPVCACGGKEFTNDCERKKAKQQLDYASACKK